MEKKEKKFNKEDDEEQCKGGEFTFGKNYNKRNEFVAVLKEGKLTQMDVS